MPNTNPSFFAWDKKQRASWLAKQLRTGVEDLANDRFREYIYRTQKFISIYNNLSPEKKQRLDILMRPREEVVANHLKHYHLAKQKKRQLLGENTPSLETANTNTLGVPATNEMAAYKDNAKKLLAKSTWLQSKEYFTYANYTPLIDTDTNPYFGMDNSGGQSYFYINMLSYVYEIEAELNKNQPDYSKILNTIQELRAYSWVVPSVITSPNANVHTIPLQITPYFGQNVFVQLLFAIVGITAALLAMFSGLLFMIPAYCINSPYFGTCQFLWDALVYLAQSCVNAVTAIVFPLSMIYAYYTTDSCNIIHGDLARSLNTIENFCKQQITLTPSMELVNPMQER